MLYNVDEITNGQQVWLYPHTRTASRNVHRCLAVRVLKDPKAHWPMVLVGWREAEEDRWELVHKDDIRKRNPSASTKAEREQGDTAQDGLAASALGSNRRLALPGKAKVVPTEGQGTLF